ncbi:MAG: DUF503 domain-containing protein [Tissierellia bacterium]|nr:DUF503 domain-containing protein [Tissierellia bacterium]
MIIGICTLELYIYHAQSLKDKRRVVKSIIDRCHHRFHVSIAEVDNMDLWQRSVIGIAYVSNDRKHTEQILDKVILEVEKHGEVEILNIEKEIL